MKMNQNIPYEKMNSHEISITSPVLIDEPIHVKPAPKRVRHFFVFSLISSICCPMTGIIALAYSLKSSAKADVNFHDKAQLYSRYALRWNLISVILSVATIVFTFVFCYQMNVMMRSTMYPQRYQQHNPDDIQKFIQSITNN